MNCLNQRMRDLSLFELMEIEINIYFIFWNQKRNDKVIYNI